MFGSDDFPFHHWVILFSFQPFIFPELYINWNPREDSSTLDALKESQKDNSHKLEITYSIHIPIWYCLFSMESHQRGLFIMYIYIMYIYIYMYVRMYSICIYRIYRYMYTYYVLHNIVILIASLGAGFKHFVFSPLFGEIVNHQLVTI